MRVNLQYSLTRGFLLSALILFLYHSPAWAVVSNARYWRFFSAVDGLAESWSSFVTIGPSGKVWVSHGEIDRLSWISSLPGPDGQFVHTMQSPGDDLKVLESGSGQLWSLYSNGIQLYRDDKWIKYRIDEITNLNPADRMVRRLIPFLPGERDLCFYLLPAGLKLFKAETGEIELILAARDTHLGNFIDMIRSRDGGIWVTGDNGAAKLDFQSGTLAPQWREYLLGALPVKRVEKPAEGENGGLIAVASGVRVNETRPLRFDGMRWSILPGFGGKVMQAWPGLGDSYWLSKQGNTMSLVENGKEEVQEKIGILAGDFFDVAVEPGGIFWLATSHGVARYTPSIWRTPVEVADIDDRVHAMFEDSQGRIWFAAVYHLLLYQGGRWKRYALPEGLSTQPYFTNSICSLSDGRIAIGTMPYLDRLLTFLPDKEKFEFVPYVDGDSTGRLVKRVIGMLSPFKDGRIMVQTMTALDSTKYRLETFNGRTFQPFLDMGDKWELGNLRFVFEAHNGDLWLGGQRKRALAVYRNGKYSSFQEDVNYTGTGGFCISEVEPGKIWVGGRDDILEYDGKSWRVVLAGLSSVRSITTGRDSSIWVASGTGIHRELRGSWVANTAEDGLINTAVFQVFQDSRGRVWAGTISGLSLYQPEADTVPPVTSIPLRENPRETTPSGEVRIIFSGVDLWQQTRADRLQFSCRLDSGPWSPFGYARVAMFKDLPYGGHLFEVRAMDTNLNLDRNPSTFQFTVLKPWYRETGFRAIVLLGSGLILILLGYAVYRHVTLEKLVVSRTAQWKMANVELENKVAELKRAEAQLLDSQKMEIIGKIASGVAHEVRNPLNAILAISEALFQELGDNPEYKPYMDNVRTQVDRLAGLMNELLDLGRPIEKSTFVRCSFDEICYSAVALWRESSGQGGRKVQILSPQGNGGMEIIGSNPKLQQVFINLLDNASQHSPEQSEITITLIKQRDRTVQALIKDQGKGLAPERLEEVFRPFYSTRPRGTGLGLSIVKNIVETHGGRIRLFNNDPPPGLTVEVDLPLA